MKKGLFPVVSYLLLAIFLSLPLLTTACAKNNGSEPPLALQPDYKISLQISSSGSLIDADIYIGGKNNIIIVCRYDMSDSVRIYDYDMDGKADMVHFAAPRGLTRFALDNAFEFAREHPQIVRSSLVTVEIYRTEKVVGIVTLYPKPQTGEEIIVMTNVEAEGYLNQAQFLYNQVYPLMNK